MLLTHVFGERIYILGSRLLIVIGVYFKPGNIDLVCITNYMHIFCMSHCVSYMYKYSFLSIHPIYQYMYILCLNMGCFWAVPCLGLFITACMSSLPQHVILLIGSCQLFLVFPGIRGMKERHGTPTPSITRRSESMVYWRSQERQLPSSPFLALT